MSSQLEDGSKSLGQDDEIFKILSGARSRFINQTGEIDKFTSLDPTKSAVSI